MKKIMEEANRANGDSRRCAKCSLHTFPKTRCNEEMWQICHDSFVEGFKKGVKYNK